MEDWKDNELYQLITTYIQPQEQADEMFSCLLPHLLEDFGDNGITVRHLVALMPSKLYKYSITTTKSYFKDFVYVIGMYKITTGADYGFPIKRYEDLYDTNVKYENAIAQKRLVKEQHQILAMEKKMKKAKCKQAIIKKEDFDDDLIISISNIKKYITKQYDDITFLDEDYIENNPFVKNLFNYRVGSLVYGNPFRIKGIKDQSIYWIGMCDCGNYRITQAGRVNDYTNCPICSEPEISYIGVRSGHLEVIDQKYLLNGKHSMTLRLKCKCDCGSEIIIKPLDFSYHSKTNCGKQCKYAIETRHINGENNTKHIKQVFQKETNFTKIGRTESNSNSSTGYLGVTFIPATNTYMAYITFQGKTELLGSTYKTAEQAYAVRLAAQNILHKEYINQMKEDKFVKQNKYLTRLLKKAEKAIETVDNIIENDN